MFAVALLMGTLAALAAGRVYERCELARDLQLLGVDRDQIATWVCIAFHESRYDTAARNHGSGDHGLLQISELYWCGPGKACGAPCSAFRDEDISDDVECALRIYREHTRLQGDGFLAWVVYPHYCKQNAKKYIVDCDKSVKTPAKFDDRARLLKTSDARQESKRQFASDPYRNAVTPRYLSINSIFQGSYVNEFERSYYDNNKQSNWLDFKVDNIDELELPAAVSAKQRSYFLESTTRPTTVTTLDPALIGIKPPSPKKIESNQFRRRKTFSQPLFQKNKFIDDQKASKTTPAPVREYSATSLSLNEDLSHNIFLNLSPSVISKSLREFSSHEIKSTDLSRYHVKTPQLEESSSSAVLSYDDLAQNPFLNSLPGFNLKSDPKSPSRATDLSHNNDRGYTLTTSRPIASLRSSKQIGWNSNIPELSKTPSKTDEDNAKISIADLAQNPFLSHLLSVKDTKTPTESKIHETNARINSRKEFSSTTARPTTKLEFYSSPKDDFIARKKQFEISTKIPTTVQRGRIHYLSNIDNTVTENPSTKRSTTMYSTRQYQTISRQRFSTNQNDLKSTTAIAPIREKLKVSSTAKPYTSETNWRKFKIETTTSKTTTTLSENLYKVTDTLRLQSVPQSTSRTEITSKLQTTRRPEAASRISAINKTEITSKPQVISRTKIVSISQTTNRPPTTSRLQTTTGLGIASKSQTMNRTETTSRPQTSSTRTISSTQATKSPKTTRLQTTNSRLQTTSRPLTTSRLPTTNRPVTTSKPQIINRTETIRLSQSTSKPEIMRGSWITSRQTTSRPETTSRPSTTLRSWSSWRSWEGSRNNASTTPRSTFTWRTATNSTLSSTTRNDSTTQKPLSTSTEATTAKTTQSIFDLYLRPSVQPSFKPFEFTNRLRKSISIFSGGTTKAPPAYFTYKKPTTEEVLRN
ncbi:flocculation protein FLO11-like [Maniola jurtina]|uniref:flocculation protein FLO11-like n=1 Tax=Maniola jurtina TaxID=191418 RepID=UPI001E68A239|nr:flocculation protein FLO11-like [Maniola jurtina]